MRLINILVPIGTVIILAAAVIPIVFVITRSEGTDDTPLVNTTVGMIRGLRAEDGTAMFLGIPYAIVDERNPFGAAIPNPTFEGVFNAINDNARCPQLRDLSETTLNCLHLNIHVPKTNSNTPLPVFIYIHGGGFTSGSSGRNNFGSKFLIRHDVIFVSINYRIAAYGFMCLHTAEVPGNQGLKDQLKALRWIKNNIKAFGGDDENITIAGDSAGGVSVDSQLLYADDGLFHKVITLSGTSLVPWAYTEPDVDAAFKIANQLGFPTNSTAEAITFLSSQTPSQVLLAAQALRLGFSPCVEKEFPNVEPFAATHPVNTPIARAKNIPLIAGYTEDEALIFYYNWEAESFETLDIFNDYINMGFDFDTNNDIMKIFVRRFYAADEPMTVNLRRAVIDFDSDFRFVHPTQRTIGKYLDYGGTVYHYVFTYIGDRNMQRVRFNITEGGATHADDLSYFLDKPDIRDSPSFEDQLMIDRITTFWTNFAKYGNPTPSTTDLLPVQWLPVTHDRLHYMNFSMNLEIHTRPFRKRLSFWDLFYYTNKEHVRGYNNESFTSGFGMKHYNCKDLC